MKNHPPNAANETISGAVKKNAMGWVVEVVIQKKIRKTTKVIKKEAMPERTSGLSGFRMLAEARTDKIPVIPR